MVSGAGTIVLQKRDTVPMFINARFPLVILFYALFWQKLSDFIIHQAMLLNVYHVPLICQPATLVVSGTRSHEQKMFAIYL